MGLDTVELVMAFEEKFEITISDDAAEQIVTVRDAIDFIYAQVRHSDSKVCLTQRSFHRLRRAIQTTLKTERSQIRPTTQWENLVPLEDRQSSWARLREAVGASSWPPLYRSPEHARAIVAASVAMAAAAFVAAPAYNPAFAAVAGLAAAMAGARATRHLCVHFRPGGITVGETSEVLAAQLADEVLSASEQGWTRDQVRTVVRAIVVEHLNVDPTFSDDARFVDDLGAD